MTERQHVGMRLNYPVTKLHQVRHQLQKNFSLIAVHHVVLNSSASMFVLEHAANVCKVAFMYHVTRHVARHSFVDTAVTHRVPSHVLHAIKSACYGVIIIGARRNAASHAHLVKRNAFGGVSILDVKICVISHAVGHHVMLHVKKFLSVDIPVSGFVGNGAHHCVEYVMRRR